MTRGVALGASSRTIRCIVGALCVLYAQSLELLGVAGTMLANEVSPPVATKPRNPRIP